MWANTCVSLVLLSLFHLRSVISEHFKSDYVLEKDGNRVLSNGKSFPLIGFGLHGVESEKIATMISAADNLGYRLLNIDMFSRSGVEKVISEAISNLNKKQIHIVAKVWYTHLGYERTKLSVRETMESLLDPLKDSSLDLQIHFLLSCARCDPQVEWMNCEEEANLPEYVKEAGETPGHDAWKESWRALEDLYMTNHPNVASIGVSNFHKNELQELIAACRIKPHIVQADLFDLKQMWHILQEHNIASQTFNVFPLLTNAYSDPAFEARMKLRKIAGYLSTEAVVSPATVLISSLANYGISVIPTTTDLQYLKENSPREVLQLPSLNRHQKTDIDEAVGFLIRMINDDEEEEEEEEKEEVFKSNSNNVQCIFQNELDSVIDVYWVDVNDGSLKPITEGTEPDSHAQVNSFKGHQFVVKSGGTIIEELEVTADIGESQIFTIRKK